MIDSLVKLKDYVPLLQTFLWLLFVSILLLIFRRPISRLINVFEKRIGKGSSVKIGPIALGEDYTNLVFVDADSRGDITTGVDGQKREEHRKKIYEDNDGLFITHMIIPSKINIKEYDIYIYLVGHKNREMSDIDRAEFFFGHMWGNKIFKGSMNDGVIGVRTLAYGPFLCTCCVKLKNGKELLLDRYIDFEMGKIVRTLL